MPNLTQQEVANLLELDGFGILSFGRTVCDDVSAYDFVAHSGLIDLNNPPVCGKCERIMIKIEKPEKTCKNIWYCSKPCQNRVNVSKNTIFEGIKITYLKQLELMLHWLYEVPVTTAAGQLGVHKKTAVSVYRMCREICDRVVCTEDVAIGGPGLHVEIDESHLFQRKYHRGRILASQHVWVFGKKTFNTKYKPHRFTLE